MRFIIIFIILSIVNVVFSTIKSLVTIHGGKISASIINGTYFAFYNVMLIYTVADFPMWQKCIITFICNVIGVFIVKYFEEKFTKEKLWKVEASITKKEFKRNKDIFNQITVPHNYIDIGDRYLVNFYCANKEQSKAVKMLLADSDAKYFVSESKTL